MFDVTTAVPMPCPNCGHGVSHLTVASKTVLTMTCTDCAHVWAAAFADMPEAIRLAVRIALLERQQHDVSGR